MEVVGAAGFKAEVNDEEEGEEREEEEAGDYTKGGEIESAVYDWYGREVEN